VFECGKQCHCRAIGVPDNAEGVTCSSEHWFEKFHLISQ